MIMMGHRQVEQAALFYEFSLERHIPADHLLQSIDRFVDLEQIRQDLAPFYSSIGRPSIDPELMIRMLLIGYCFGIRSERRLCDEVHLNLAYRWFCRLGLDGAVPDHSTFSKNSDGRFRQSDLFRRVLESVLRRCIRERLVGGEGFAVDASLIKADANRQNGIEGERGLPREPRAERSMSIWPSWMMLLSEQRPKSRRSSCHPRTQRRAGQGRTAVKPSSLTRQTT
ncbi:transposase [Bradyrhizobium sp. LB11.1]